MARHGIVFEGGLTATSAAATAMATASAITSSPAAVVATSATASATSASVGIPSIPLFCQNVDNHIRDSQIFDRVPANVQLGHRPKRVAIL